MVENTQKNANICKCMGKGSISIMIEIQIKTKPKYLVYFLNYYYFFYGGTRDLTQDLVHAMHVLYH